RQPSTDPRSRGDDRRAMLRRSLPPLVGMTPAACLRAFPHVPAPRRAVQALRRTRRDSARARYGRWCGPERIRPMGPAWFRLALSLLPLRLDEGDTMADRVSLGVSEASR